MKRHRAKRAAFSAPMRRFVEEYLLDLNQTHAAIRAGYSPRSAASIASRLMEKLLVKDAIEKALAARTNRVQVSQDRVVQELLRVALADPAGAFDEKGNVLPIHQMPEDLRRAISGMDVEEIFAGSGEDREQIGQVRKLRLWDKTKALELLARHIGMFPLGPQTNVNIASGVIILPAKEPVTFDATREES